MFSFVFHLRLAKLITSIKLYYKLPISTIKITPSQYYDQ